MLFKEYFESSETYWYHGSSDKIEKFSDEFVGEGIDQEGPGIYFTN